MTSTVTVTGDDRTASILVAKGDAATDLKDVMDRQARQAVRRITGVPQDTGRLAASIEVLDVTDSGFEVGSQVTYAHYVFDGTRYMDARPPRIATGAIARSSAVDINRRIQGAR